MTLSAPTTASGSRHYPRIALDGFPRSAPWMGYQHPQVLGTRTGVAVLPAVSGSTQYVDGST